MRFEKYKRNLLMHLFFDGPDGARNVFLACED